MEKAIVFNMISGRSREMTAAEFERRYIGNQQLGITAKFREQAENMVAVSPKDMMPLRFSGSYRSAANKRLVPAHWARPNGFGDHDHVFTDREPPLSFSNAVAAGKKVLINLNMELLDQTLTDQPLKDPQGIPLVKWLKKNKGQYVPLSVNTVEQTINAIKRVNKLCPDDQSIENILYVRYGDMIMPYRAFYMGMQTQRMMSMYENMQSGESGATIGDTRRVGFPRLWRMQVSQSTLNERGTDGLKGGYTKLRGKQIFSKLIFEKREDVLRTPAFLDLEKEFLQEGGGAYILACPSVTVIDPKTAAKGKIGMIRWVIMNTDSQTSALNATAREKILDYNKTRFEHAEQSHG